MIKVVGNDPMVNLRCCLLMYFNSYLRRAAFVHWWIKVVFSFYLCNRIDRIDFRSLRPLYKLKTLKNRPHHGYFYKENLVSVDLPINQEIELQRNVGTKIEVLVNGKWHSLEKYIPYPRH